MRQIILIATTLVAFLYGPATQSTEIFNIAQGKLPRIATDSAKNINLVFEGYEKNSDVREILYSKSNANISTWTAPLNISRTTHVSTAPAIAIEDSGAIDVVWLDTSSGELHPDIFFTRSTDAGQTWSQALDISHTTGKCSEPAIATGVDNSIHVVWVDTRTVDGRPDIFYSCSIDGQTWSACESISPTPGISSEPTIVTGDDGVIHCAWLDTSSGEERPDIFYTHKVNNVWTIPMNVSNSPRISDHPWLASGAKERIFLCWADNSQKKNAADIWCAIGRNGRFAKPINISDTPGVSSQPIVIANKTGNVAVIWSDTSLKTSKPDTFARASTDNGDDFSNVLYVTDTEGISKHSTAVFVGTKMIVVWEEVVGFISKLKATTIELKNISTGPVDQVNPTIHRVNR